MEVLVEDARPNMPACFQGLETSALTEGIRNVSRLLQEWSSGETLFDGPGECLLIARVNNEAVGVGGLLECKDVPGSLRVSRFYVLPSWRNQGIGKTLAEQVISHAFRYTDLITCNAHASESAAPFWEGLGFQITDRHGITHILKREKVGG